MINLYEFVSSHDFIEHLPQDTNYTIFTDGLKGHNTANIQWFSFVEMFQDPNTLIFNTNVICIATTITTDDIKTINETLKSPCTWINCNTGLLSIIKKTHPEQNDIVPMLEQGYKVKEPISQDDFISNIQKNVYMRIFDRPLAHKLSELTWDKGVAYLSGSQTQTHFTVLSTVSVCDDVVGTLHQSSKGSDNIFELYIWSEYSTELSQALIHSIQRTQHIIIIIDHKATEELRLFCETLIKNHAGKQIHIQYIFPQMHLISSILEEYIYEEAQFDQPAFEAYIMNSIEYYNKEHSI